eukprot:gene37137-11681_t
MLYRKCPLNDKTCDTLLSVWHHGIVEGKAQKLHFSYVDGDNEPTQVLSFKQLEPFWCQPDGQEHEYTYEEKPKVVRDMRLKMQDIALFRLMGPMHSASLIVKDATGEGRAGKAVPVVKESYDFHQELFEYSSGTNRITSVRMASTAWAVDRDLKMQPAIIRTPAPQTSVKWTRHEQTTVLLRPVVDTVCGVQVLKDAHIQNLSLRLKKMRDEAHTLATKAGIPAKLQTSARMLRDLVDERCNKHLWSTDFWLCYELTLADLQKRLRLAYTHFNPWQQRWEKTVQINLQTFKAQFGAAWTNPDKAGTYTERWQRMAVNGAPQLTPWCLFMNELQIADSLYCHGPYMLTPAMHAANRLANDIKRQEKAVQHNAFYNELMKKVCAGL